MGNGANAILRDASPHQAEQGCSSDDVCARADACPAAAATCHDDWNARTCQCAAGAFGAQCHAVCAAFNPCANGSQCVRAAASAAGSGYSCRCPPGSSGQYCDVTELSTCPASWWGAPICGPCNCPRDRGFNTSCDRTTGQCDCLVSHDVTSGQN